jgi:dihydrofolate reductase
MKLIVATEKNWGIGKDNGLLVHLPGDLKYFKQKTLGKVVIMGRKTLESLPGGRPLPDRTNIVISRNPAYKPVGCIVAASCQEAAKKALMLAGEGGGDKVMVIGGESIYEQMLPLCDTCYVTRLDGEFEADCHFPNLDLDPHFQITWESEVQEEKGVTYRFVEYSRV